MLHVEDHLELLSRLGDRCFRINYMWRIWTRGWGFYAWWYWFKTEGFPMWIAFHTPRNIALWTFIRVYGSGVDSPGEEYKQAYNSWIKK